jgi:hypothetical protein
VDDDGSRLYMHKAEAAVRLQAQIEQGKEIHRVITQATGLTDLETLKSRLSRWSQHNQQVLVAIFGESERSTYRSAGLRRATVQGFSARRTQMEHVTASRLEYLDIALARVNMSAEKPTGSSTDKKPWWRVFLDHPWTIAVAAPIMAAPVITIITLALTGGSAGSITLTGSVVCESGRPVVGVWIAATTGQSDSGFAHLGPANPSGISYPVGSIASYSYLLPHGGSYAVHVGCGGNASAWDSSNYSPLLSGQNADLRCDDPTTLPVDGTSARGVCTVVTGT